MYISISVNGEEQALLQCDEKPRIINGAEYRTGLKEDYVMEIDYDVDAPDCDECEKLCS